MPEPQEIAVNALHPKSSGTCTPICQPSTTMTSSNVQDFAGDNLISALQMSTGANAPGDTINNFEVTSSRMLEGSQYPMVVKPSIVHMNTRKSTVVASLIFIMQSKDM